MVLQDMHTHERTHTHTHTRTHPHPSHTHLFKAELSMPCCDALPQLVGQRVQHAVVRVHRGQAVLLQLVTNNRDNLEHTLIIVAPIAHNL